MAVGPSSRDPGTAKRNVRRPKPRPKKGWRTAEVERAIAAAEQAGLDSYRVEIGSEGIITIIVGAPAVTDSDPSKT